MNFPNDDDNSFLEPDAQPEAQSDLPLQAEPDSLPEWFEPEAPTPFWTRRRIFLTVIAIVIVVTLMAYMFSGLFVPPRPTPTPIPGQMI